MSQAQNPQKQKNSFLKLFSGKFFIELQEKERKIQSKGIDELVIVLEAKINGRTTTLPRDRRYSDILESLSKKIEVLKYVSEEGYEPMKNEIINDLMEILYKLEKKERW